MNALRTTVQRSMGSYARRFATVAAKTPQRPVPEIYNYNFKKAFLNDPSTYPLIVIMSVAMTFMTGMSINALTNYKGLRLNPARKQEVITTWGEDRRDTVTQYLASEPVGFWRKGLKDIRHEGLGVDHDEWQKGKDTYSKTA